MRFYGRHGARILDLPYFQPALRPVRSRVYRMLLLALHVDPRLAGPGGPATVAADPEQARSSGPSEEETAPVARSDLDEA